MIDHVDIAIIGGGPVGASLALGLQGSGLSVAVLSAAAPKTVADIEAAMMWRRRPRLHGCPDSVWFPRSSVGTRLGRSSVQRRKAEHRAQAVFARR